MIARWAFLAATATVWLIAHATHNRTWGGLWVLMVLFLVAWNIDDGRARRRRRRVFRPFPTTVVDSGGVEHSLDDDRARTIARVFGVPDAVVGIPTPRWRRLVQRITRR